MNEWTKGEAPREEGDEREQRIAEDDQTPGFVDFITKDLEDVERFDYMMQKRRFYRIEQKSVPRSEDVFPRDVETEGTRFENEQDCHH